MTTTTTPATPAPTTGAALIADLAPFARALRAAFGSAVAQWNAYRARRRIAAAALDDFATMGEREFRDIGMSRADAHRVAWGAAPRAPDGR